MKLISLLFLMILCVGCGSMQSKLACRSPELFHPCWNLTGQRACRRPRDHPNDQWEQLCFRRDREL